MKTKYTIVLLGRPGCGKGTFVKRVLLANGFNPTRLPMSDALKGLASEDPEKARIIEACTNSGILVPNPIVIPAFLRAFRKIGEDTLSVIDGVPRDEEQLYALRTGLQQNGANADTRVILVHLRTREAICGYRLRIRAAEEGRPDDTPETIVRRMMEYDAKTKPFVDNLDKMAPTFGWDFFRFNGNDIHGSAAMFLEMLHLPDHLKVSSD